MEIQYLYLETHKKEDSKFFLIENNNHVICIIRPESKHRCNPRELPETAAMAQKETPKRYCGFSFKLRQRIKP